MSTIAGYDAHALVRIVIMPTGRSAVQISIAGGLEPVCAIDVCKSYINRTLSVPSVRA
jgi:hypothetical protein